MGMMILAIAPSQQIVRYGAISQPPGIPLAGLGGVDPDR